jgi:uncharacterized RDD family membrane protein YckC
MSKYNTTGARIAAAIVDYIVFIPLSFLDEYLFAEFSGKTSLLILWTIVSLSLFQIYSIIMHGQYGQTLGKKAMSIKIVTYPVELPISYKHAFIRDLPYTILIFLNILLSVLLILYPELIFNSSLMSIVGILGFAGIFWILLEIVTMLFNDKKRAIHDIIAKTIVIKV